MAPSTFLAKNDSVLGQCETILEIGVIDFDGLFKHGDTDAQAKVQKLAFLTLPNVTPIVSNSVIGGLRLQKFSDGRSLKKLLKDHHSNFGCICHMYT